MPPDTSADETETPNTPLPETAPPEQSEQPTPAPVSVSGPKKRGSKKSLAVIILVIVVLAAGGALAYHLKNNKKPVAVKKDIPSITDGDVGADLSQEYPFDTDITVNAQVDTQLFEGLVRYSNQTKIVPLLATSWSNPDNSTWVFNLRHGVKFHSGRTMTAADVKYSLDYAVAHQGDNDASNFTALASTIKQVTVVNSYQVKITTDGPDPILLNRLASLYILDSKSKPTDFNDGTGPYTIQPGTKPSANEIDLAASNSYWGGHVYTRALHIRIEAGTNQMLADIKAGKLNTAGPLSNAQLKQINNAQFTDFPIPDLGVTILGLDTERSGSPLASLAGRQAVAYALNIPQILKAGGIDGVQASQIVPQTLAGYDPSIKNIPYDPAKAKQLLASLPNAGAQITLVYNDDSHTATLQEITKELEAVGFNVKLQELADFNTLITEGLGGQVDMFYATTSSSTVDGADVFASALEGNQDYNNPDISTLLDQAGSTLDASSRLTDLQKVSKIVATDLPDISLYNQTHTYIINKSYQAKVDIPSAEGGIYFWQVYQQ